MIQITRWEHRQHLTVSNGANDSNSFSAMGLSFGSIQLPYEITGTSINFKVSNDNVTFTIPTDKEGTSLAQIDNVAANDMIEVPPLVWLFDFWKVTFITAQGAARTIKAIGKG